MKYEYSGAHITVAQGLIKELNNMGSEGWDVVHMQETQNAEGDGIFWKVIFKRPIGA